RPDGLPTYAVIDTARARTIRIFRQVYRAERECILHVRERDGVRRARRASDGDRRVVGRRCRDVLFRAVWDDFGVDADLAPTARVVLRDDELTRITEVSLGLRMHGVNVGNRADLALEDGAGGGVDGELAAPLIGAVDEIASASAARNLRQHGRAGPVASAWL